ncbi:hypothetical protein SAMN02745119_00753 [Trichlorobacter thiogenes]|uniref:Uncharacterized protein n=1 Tax=Trichlorobacter thiogenes TaxID=115783 RepID=A0A1T4L3W5_9BACT|nr:hypothetical protein SAMN02745119_00753 [Trichlorobacter thiogenes]
MTFYPPEYNKDNFNCPYCGVYSVQKRAELGYSLHSSRYYTTRMSVALCTHRPEPL